jgi:hypothetical protein
MSTVRHNEPLPTDRRKAADLIAAGFHQVSRTHGLLAKLPDGMTGIAALTEASHDAVWVKRLGERQAARQFMRVYAKPPNVIRVDQSTLVAFRKAGGPVA